MVDCACLAGIVALKHFRRPEVEVEGDEVTIVRCSVLDLWPGPAACLHSPAFIEIRLFHDSPLPLGVPPLPPPQLKASKLVSLSKLSFCRDIYFHGEPGTRVT